MRKLSPKTALLAVFLCAGVLILYSCIVPVGQLEKFLEDETVTDYIESGGTTVKVDNQTDESLQGRNGRIEGLNPNKYYMVEKELNEAFLPVNAGAYPKYVTANPASQEGYGILTSNLGEITKISGGRITGLTNLHTYTVRTAKPLSAPELSYNDGTDKEETITNGIVTIANPEGSSCEFDLSVIFGAGNYIAVPDPDTRSPGTDYDYSAKSGTTVSQKAGTTVDYVFAGDDPEDFKFLRVSIETYVPKGMEIIITLDIVAGMPNIEFSSNIFRLSNFGTGQITLNSVIGAPDNVEWYYAGESVGTGETLILTNDESSIGTYLVAGTHVFTVIVTIDGIPYSADFTLTVYP